MPKFIALADVNLSTHDEYYSSIDDVYLGIYEADSEDDVLELVNSEWDNSDSIESLGDWVKGTGYYLKVKKVEN